MKTEPTFDCGTLSEGETLFVAVRITYPVGWECGDYPNKTQIGSYVMKPAKRGFHYTDEIERECRAMFPNATDVRAFNRNGWFFSGSL